MSELIKIKQIEQLATLLAGMALDSEVLKISNALSDVNALDARDNLSLYSKSEIDALFMGANSAYIVADQAAKNALTDLQVTDRVFITNDGDGKWAMYIVAGVTNGQGSTSTYIKIADQDLFENAMSAAAVKAAYESNANTNAFTNALKAKLDKITIASNIDLDQVKSVADAAATAAAGAQSSANAAQTTANNAQTAANQASADAADALSAVNSKEEAFTQTTETFTGFGVDPTVQINLVLAHNIKSGHEVFGFFNGVRIKNITGTPGSNNVQVVMPFVTEPSDEIMVTYAY